MPLAVSVHNHGRQRANVNQPKYRENEFHKGVRGAYVKMTIKHAASPQEKMLHAVYHLLWSMLFLPCVSICGSNIPRRKAGVRARVQFTVLLSIVKTDSKTVGVSAETPMAHNVIISRIYIFFCFMMI